MYNVLCDKALVLPCMYCTGLRGVALQYWNNTGTSQQYANMHLITPSWTPASDYSASVLTDKWETPFNGIPHCA